MKRLRRRKSSDNAHGSSVNPEIHSVPEDEAQLYARFSAAHRSHDPSRSSKPIVSGPMALTAKPMSPSVVGRGAIPERGIVHIPNRNEQPPKVLASPPSRKSSRAALLSAVQEYTHAHPSHPKPLSAISADPASEYDLSHLPQTIPTATRPPSPPVPVRIDLGRRHHAQYDIQPISANHEPPAVVPSRKPSRHPPLSQDNLQETISQAQATKERHRVYVPAPAQQVSTYNDDEEYDPFKAIPTIVKPPPPQNGRNCLPTASQEPVVQDNSAPAGLPDTSEKQLPLPPEPILTRHSPPITGPTLTPARSLLNAPSLVRKKYSPLAAFGLPTAQTTSTPPVASQSSGTLPQQV